MPKCDDFINMPDFLTYPTTIDLTQLESTLLSSILVEYSFLTLLNSITLLVKST